MTTQICLALGLSLAATVAEAAPAPATQEPPFKLPDNVELRADVVYGKGGGRDLKLDLFLPKAGQSPRPGILFIHGGGWSGGNRHAFYRQAAYLASKRGYVGACIEYRLSGEAKFPAAVEDAKCAVRWLRANAKTYGVDPNRIAGAGGSAGGHLVAMLALTDRSAGLEGTGGNPELSSRVNLAIVFNGPTDMTALAGRAQTSNPVSSFLGAMPTEKPELYRQASPVTFVDKQAPPFLFLHGTADMTVPIEQAKLLQRKLREVGVQAELYEAPGAAHGFFNGPPFYEPTLQRMEAFLVEHFAPQYRTPNPAPRK
jgi:acetyl esterase/lipase